MLESIAFEHVFHASDARPRDALDDPLARAAAARSAVLRSGVLAGAMPLISVVMIVGRLRAVDLDRRTFLLVGERSRLSTALVRQRPVWASGGRRSRLLALLASTAVTAGVARRTDGRLRGRPHDHWCSRPRCSSAGAGAPCWVSAPSSAFTCWPGARWRLELVPAVTNRRCGIRVCRPCGCGTQSSSRFLGLVVAALELYVVEQLAHQVLIHRELAERELPAAAVARARRAGQRPRARRARAGPARARPGAAARGRWRAHVRRHRPRPSTTR
mgnify:CR=1 FL=1